MRTWLPLADSIGPTTGTPASAPAGVEATAPAAPAGGAAAPTDTQGATSTTQPATTGPSTLPAAGKTPTIGDMLTQALPFILIVVVFYLFMFRGRGKEEKTRRKQLESLKRGDEVQMIGGLIGKIVDVKEDRVVIKVDEANNVKETYLKSAIHRVLDSEDKDKGKEDTK